MKMRASRVQAQTNVSEATFLQDKRKAPLTFQSRTPRQPSPRTAKPRLDSRIGRKLCKRHFGNPISVKLRKALTEATVATAFARFGRSRRWSRLRRLNW